jgi:undecaprenyl-diphosphatase
MKKEAKVVIFVILALSIILSFCLDKELIKAISLLRIGILDSFFLGITFASSEIIIFFVLTAFFLWSEHKREWIFPLWACLGISAVISLILKVTVQRLRPFQLGIVSLIPKLQEASFNTWNFSFPSFQSMLVFSAISILSKEFPKLKNVWIGFAVLVAFSRLYFGVHFVSDVLIGSLIGYAIGAGIVKLEKENKWGKNFYNKIMRR